MLVSSSPMALSFWTLTRAIRNCKDNDSDMRKEEQDLKLSNNKQNRLGCNCVWGLLGSMADLWKYLPLYFYCTRMYAEKPWRPYSLGSHYGHDSPGIPYCSLTVYIWLEKAPLKRNKQVGEMSHVVIL